MSEESEPVILRQLFIGNLDFNFTEESLKSHFEQWGEIVDCTIIEDHHTRKSRGYGFITYKRAHMVDDAQASRPHYIHGRNVFSRRVIPKKVFDNPESHVIVHNLYVSGIGEDLGEEDLREYFGPYGNILRVNVVTDKNTGKKRGFANVEFDDHDPIDKILLKSHKYKGRELKVKKFFSREERYRIKMKKEMGRFGRGICARVGDREKLRTADEFHKVGRGGGYRGSNGDSGYGEGYNNGGGVWNCGYGVNYTSGGGGGNFGSSSGRGRVWNNGYGASYTSGGGGDNFGSSSGERFNNGGGVWKDGHGVSYTHDVGSRVLVPSYGGGPIRGNANYAHRNQRPYGGFGGR